MNMLLQCDFNNMISLTAQTSTCLQIALLPGYPRGKQADSQQSQMAKIRQTNDFQYIYHGIFPDFYSLKLCHLSNAFSVKTQHIMCYTLRFDEKQNVKKILSNQHVQNSKWIPNFCQKLNTNSIRSLKMFADAQKCRVSGATKIE